MGKKRKREQSEDRILKRIKRLEKKLHKRRRIDSSEDESSCSPRSQTLEMEPAVSHTHEVRSPSPPPARPSFESAPATPPIEANVVSQGEMDELPPMELLVESLAEPSTSVTPDETLPVLDNETLLLLGEAPQPEVFYSNPIHKDISSRWIEILKKGLNKETKDEVFKNYPIPNNCKLLLPPILNPEVKAALTESFIKRDSSLVTRQKHLSVAISALSQIIDKLISNKEYQSVKPEFLKPISDACRIMCDMHHYETQSRKKFVISSINSELKETLVNAETDNFLFGDNMSEKLRSAKTVQRSGEALKVTRKVVTPRNLLQSRPYNRNPENFKTLHQRRPGAGKYQAGLSQQSPYPPSRGPVRPAPPRGPRHQAPPAPATAVSYRKSARY